MAVSFAIESWIEGGVVTAIILLNVVIGFFQEFNAEKTMDSLRSLSSPTASAVRDGKTVTVPTIEVVVGDLVEMKTGDTVPADVRYVQPQHNTNPPLTLHPVSSKLSTLKPTRLF
jgi:Na+-exporting ATPase